MSEKAIEQMPAWKEPSALDLLAGFRDKYGRAVRAVEEQAPEAGLEYFERELHRIIQAFVNEATKPWRDGYVDAVARQIPQGIVLVSKETLEQLPSSDQELWRGQHCGVWYRVVLGNGFRPKLQVSYNASLGEEHEVWQLQ